MFEKVIVNGGRRRQTIVGINYKKLNDMAIEPTQGSAAAAGLDLHAAINSPVEIKPHETAKIGTGLSFELPEETFGAIFARSGLATKKGLRPANCVGVVDSDYRGEVMVAVHNDTDEAQFIDAGDRIAQLIVMPYLPIKFEETEELSNTIRGDNGFGSTGA